jgi:GNAT superfamily N-acetyltransferase
MSAGNGTNSKRRGRKRNGACGPRAALTVRPAGQGDRVPLGFFLDSVLRKDYFIRRGQLDDILSGKYHQVHVAEIESVLVGVAITTRGSRLVNALVHPAYRGLGIGRELVRASGASEVRAKIDMSTGDPRGFYTALGFEPTGHFNGKRNVEVMRLSKRRANGRHKTTDADICGVQDSNRTRTRSNGGKTTRGK